MNLSVVVCTYDRYDALAEAVATLTSRDDFDATCDLLVVDNTPAARRRPVVLPTNANARVCVCDAPGLSRARNQGIAQSSGDVIAFLDDDALADDGWCEAIRRRFATAPGALALGGKVVPLYAGNALPAWYDDRLAGYLSCVDWGAVPRFLRRGEWVVGANVAFRRTVFETFGGFDETLGRKGTGSLLSNEETALLDRVGVERVFYDPAMAVRHVIPVERLTARWFRRRVYWQAVSDLVAGAVRDDDPALLREYGETVARLPAEHRNLRALSFEPADAETFALQLRAVYLAAIVLGHGGLVDARRVEGARG